MIRITVSDEHAIPQLQSYLSRLGWLAVAREAGALEAELPGAGGEHAELQELVGYLQAWQLRHPQVSLQLAPENSLAPNPPKFQSRPKSRPGASPTPPA